MKKLTSIALGMLFLLSIIVVGVFGMKNVPYKEIIYTEDLVFTKVYASHPSMVIAESPVSRNETVINQRRYLAIINVGNLKAITPEEPLTVMIDYKILPENATDKSVEIKFADGTEHAVINNGKITLTKAVNFTLSYRRLDSGGSEIIYIQILIKGR